MILECSPQWKLKVSNEGNSWPRHPSDDTVFWTSSTPCVVLSRVALKIQRPCTTDWSHFAFGFRTPIVAHAEDEIFFLFWMEEEEKDWLLLGSGFFLCSFFSRKWKFLLRSGKAHFFIEACFLMKWAMWPTIITVQYACLPPQCFENE